MVHWRCVQAFHVTLTETLSGADGYCLYSPWIAAPWLGSQVFLILISNFSKATFPGHNQSWLVSEA